MSIKTDYRSLSRAVEYLGFGFCDDVGRPIGVRITRQKLEFFPISDEARSWHTIEPGVHFVVDTHATRCGISYGASQRRHYFRTEAAAEAHVAAAVEKMRKRYVKKFGAA